MWKAKKRNRNDIGSEFIGTIFWEKYQEMMKNNNKKSALPHLRRAALLLFPLKPELWDEYIRLRQEVFPGRSNNRRKLSELSREMEDL